MDRVKMGRNVYRPVGKIQNLRSEMLKFQPQNLRGGFHKHLGEGILDSDLAIEIIENEEWFDRWEDDRNMLAERGSRLEELKG